MIYSLAKVNTVDKQIVKQSPSFFFVFNSIQFENEMYILSLILMCCVMLCTYVFFAFYLMICIIPSGALLFCC